MPWKNLVESCQIQSTKSSGTSSSILCFSNTRVKSEDAIINEIAPKTLSPYTDHPWGVWHMWYNISATTSYNQWYFLSTVYLKNRKQQNLQKETKFKKNP